jgi:hypothetical protein
MKTAIITFYSLGIGFLGAFSLAAAGKLDPIFIKPGHKITFIGVTAGLGGFFFWMGIKLQYLKK